MPLRRLDDARRARRQRGRQPVLEGVGRLDDVVVDRDHGVAHLAGLGLGQEEIVVRHRPEYARGRRSCRVEHAALAHARGWILGRSGKGGGVVALVIVSTFVVLVLGILVAGLLRSHADILRALHELGAGVGDPSAASACRLDGSTAPAAPVDFTPPASSPPLGAAPAIAGRDPDGGRPGRRRRQQRPLHAARRSSPRAAPAAPRSGTPCRTRDACSCPTTPAWSSSPRAPTARSPPRSGPRRPGGSRW